MSGKNCTVGLISVAMPRKECSKKPELELTVFKVSKDEPENI